MIEIDEGRRGDWMQTFTGNKFWPLDPRPDEIDIVDIAHALSLQSRFAGHCKFHYSVAQHSLYVVQLSTHKIEALLHDAAEAYLVDLPRPVKYQSDMAAYLVAEDRICKAIAIKFGLIYPWPSDVKIADNHLLTYEHMELMGIYPTAKWSTDIREVVDKGKLGITKQDPEMVEELFMDTFVKLAGKKS